MYTPEMGEAEEFQENYDLSSIKLQVTYDTCNDLFFPTSGQKTFTAVEQAESWLGGDVNFTRLTLGSGVFFRIAEHTVLGLRYDTGLIIPGREKNRDEDLYVVHFSVGMAF